MKKELFNLKTVERLSSKIKLNNKQKVAVKSWLYLLEQGKLKKEKLNYIKFVEYILKDLLGYDIRKDMDFEAGNIEFSFKNKQGKTILGIEAKGTKTKDLFAEQKGYGEGQKTPINQLWNYMGKLNLDYGIATNYKDFVLIDRAKGSSTYHFFDFEEVKNNDNKLKEFIAIFSKEQIIDNNFVEKLKEESDIEEKNFTKEFYKLFHETRLMLVKEFQENGVSKEESIHYAQLFLNRLMFVFFAEDTSKLEKRLFENLIVKVLDSGMLITEHSNFISEAIRGFFISLDKGSQTPTKIFGFNGGLFGEEIPPKVYFKDLRNKKFYVEIYQHSKLKKEPELDPISKKVFLKYENKINPIIKNLLIMASFDFNTEVSVNILGHIFEQSLSDLEELKEGRITKRKKEGIYYTPEYITDYICRNTIISYLSKGKASTPRDLVLEHQKNIKELEEKFSSIKILDPACGSGAFLIKAVDILLEIHKEIQLFKQDKGEYTAIKKGRKNKKDEGQLILVKWNEEDEAREIIERNIFGVDINEESVEITKLSLFLKIAKKNKKLIDLSKNIKCGNSLIDDEEIGGKLAFDWDKEFPFKFDIVIGNPPYVSQKGTSENPNIDYKEREYYRKTYDTLSSNELSTRGGVKLNLFSLWIERGMHLLKESGFLSLIVHKNLLKVESYKFLRKYLLDNTTISEIFDLGAGIFDNVTGETIILRILNEKQKNNKIIIKENINLEQNKFKKRKITQDTFNETLDNMFNIYQDDSVSSIKSKMQKNSENLENCYDIVSFGLNTKDNKKYFLTTQKDIKWKKAVMGRDIARWKVKSFGYVFYDDSVLTRKGDIESFNSKEKLILQRIGSGLVAAYDDEKLYCYNSTNMILSKIDDYSIKYVLCLLNSKLVNYYYVNVFSMKSSLTVNVTQGYLSQIPIPKISEKEQKPFIEKADLMLKLNKEFYEKKNKFLKLIKHEYKIEKVNKKLDKFYELDFDDFMKQLKVNLSMDKKSELLDFFEKNKKELSKLKLEIDKTDKEINNMVYKLYNLSNQEIKIIEDSLRG